MKKILFLCDGTNFSTGAFQFIREQCNQSSVSVKGLFFTPIDFQQLVSISYIPITAPYARLKEEEKKMVAASQERFSGLCKENKIEHYIHHKAEEWSKEFFIKESRFADLAVISEELFCADVFSEQPNYFMKEALKESECPVLIVPETFKAIDRLAIAYNGKKESMLALKQFSYLFPYYSHLPVHLVYIGNDTSNEIPHQELLEEYSYAHFDNATVSKFHFDKKEQFTAWLEEKKNVLLITGSYSRSGVSNLLKPSFAGRIISKHASPVFVAHSL